jgi:hypothetical protein
MHAVILAGGGGTRLWPLSRPDLPKPFLPLVGDRTLLQQTWDRIVPSVVGAADVAVVTDRRYEALVRRQLPDLEPGMLLAEPAGRNTAAAVAFALAASCPPITWSRTRTGSARSWSEPRGSPRRPRPMAARGSSSPSGSRRMGPRPATATSCPARRSRAPHRRTP